MSNDKRTVSTDALETLGTIINENEKRDAIHLAVIPVQAKDWLIPGDHVGIYGTRQTSPGGNPVGIVDPFLEYPVMPGQYFWLVIYPRKITSLRHVWSHPDIPEDTQYTEREQDITEDKKNSMEWIQNYSATVGFTFDKIMECANDWVTNDEMYIGGEEMQEEYVPDEFWSHYEIVTGENLEKSKKGNFFGCAC